MGDKFGKGDGMRNIGVLIIILFVVIGCAHPPETAGYLGLYKMFDTDLVDPQTNREVGYKTEVYVDIDVLKSKQYKLGPFIEIDSLLGKTMTNGHFVPLSSDMGGGLKFRVDNWELILKGGSIHGFDRFSRPEKYNFYGMRYNF